MCLCFSKAQEFIGTHVLLLVELGERREKGAEDEKPTHPYIISEQAASSSVLKAMPPVGSPDPTAPPFDLTGDGRSSVTWGGAQSARGNCEAAAMQCFPQGFCRVLLHWAHAGNYWTF